MITDSSWINRKWNCFGRCVPMTLPLKNSSLILTFYLCMRALVTILIITSYKWTKVIVNDVLFIYDSASLPKINQLLVFAVGGSSGKLLWYQLLNHSQLGDEFVEVY